MLAALYNVPKSENAIASWSFQHDQEHRAIVIGIGIRFQITLQDYILDPIATFDIENWFRRHQTAHNDFNGVLQLDGSDLTSVDVNNAEQFQAWIELHANEHFNASRVLGIQ